MLHSANVKYQLYALEHLDPSQYKGNNARIGELFLNGIPLVRTVIVKNIPTEIWDSQTLQAPFWDAFDKVDIDSRSLLLRHLKSASDEALVTVFQNLELLTKNQLRALLDFLGTGEISAELLEHLKLYAEANQAYSYLAQQFLENL